VETPEPGRGGHPGQAEARGDDPRLDPPPIGGRIVAPTAPRIDPALAAELHRGHIRQTFTYQFSQIAVRRAPESPATRFPTLRPYIYRLRFGTPSPGLAAVKHAQAEDQRTQAIEAFRFNAKVRGRHRAEEQQRRSDQAIEHAKPKNLKSREEQRIEAAVLAREAWRLMQPPPRDYLFMSFEERVAMHYVAGTLTEFLESLRLG
jgi:hypothetical protein